MGPSWGTCGTLEGALGEGARGHSWGSQAGLLVKILTLHSVPHLGASTHTCPVPGVTGSLFGVLETK